MDQKSHIINLFADYSLLTGMLTSSRYSQNVCSSDGVSPERKAELLEFLNIR